MPNFLKGRKRFFFVDLTSRGFLIDRVSCRLCGNEEDCIKHYVAEHHIINSNEAFDDRSLRPTNLLKPTNYDKNIIKIFQKFPDEHLVKTPRKHVKIVSKL